MPELPLGSVSGAPSRAPEHSVLTSSVLTSSSLERRSLVRAALWSAPAVAVAVAAPAAAASGAAAPSTETSTLSFDTWQSYAVWEAGRRTGITTLVQVQNRYWTDHSTVGAPVSTLSVRVLYPASCRVAAKPESVSGEGWSFTTAVAHGQGAVEYWFAWSGRPLEPGRSTPQLSYTVTASVQGTVHLSAVASAPNARAVESSGRGGDFS